MLVTWPWPGLLGGEQREHGTLLLEMALLSDQQITPLDAQRLRGTRVQLGYSVPCPQLPSLAPAVQPILYNHCLDYQGCVWKRIEEPFDLQEASLQGREISIFRMWIMSSRGRHDRRQHLRVCAAGRSRASVSPLCPQATTPQMASMLEDT